MLDFVFTTLSMYANVHENALIDENHDFLALNDFLDNFQRLNSVFDACADRQLCWHQLEALGLRIKRFPKSVEQKKHLRAESARKAIVG